MLYLLTPRLILRCWYATDVDALFELCSDERVMKFVGRGHAWTYERCQAFIQHNQRMLPEHGYCQWAVITRDCSRLIGFCGFVPVGDAAGDGPVRRPRTAGSGVTELEIGWRLAWDAQKRGYAREAAGAALRWAREAGVHRVYATVQAQNSPSIRLAERIGMTLLDSRLSLGRETHRYGLTLSGSDGA
ncbi:MAG: GNAT family N-acetyltransferase [Planctomycetaceae bacterium]